MRGGRERETEREKGAYPTSLSKPSTRELASCYRRGEAIEAGRGVGAQPARAG